jgi:hypothetical protein
MTHRYDRSGKNDPYVAAARNVEQRVFPSNDESFRAAEDQSYEVLSNAIVSALGDIAATAYRFGINSPQHIKGLTRAVQDTCEVAFATYCGELDVDAALGAIRDDPRFSSLTEEAQAELLEEIDKTHDLEHLLLSGRRLPDLVDYANSLGLEIDYSIMDQGTVLLGQHPTPHAPDR